MDYEPGEVFFVIFFVILYQISGSREDDFLCLFGCVDMIASAVVGEICSGDEEGGGG